MALSVRLTHEENVALCELARHDLRSPRDEIRFLLRKEARDRGLIEEGLTQNTNGAPEPGKRESAVTHNPS
jgi:hypothetical protein